MSQIIWLIQPHSTVMFYNIIKWVIGLDAVIFAYGNNQKREGKTDLAEFIENREAKVVDEALSVGWELEEAEGKMERSKKSRAEILYSQLGKECGQCGQGVWWSTRKPSLL